MKDAGGNGNFSDAIFGAGLLTLFGAGLLTPPNRLTEGLPA